MNANDPEFSGQSPTERAETSQPQDDPGTSGGTKVARWRWFLLRGIAFGGAFLVILGLLTASAGWYTSRPEFCRSCHNMEPYYQSWKHSSHSEVSCIKCHFPPGVGEKVRGKMLGLVQLAKYVTRSEGPRPAAEIPDASCLRSGCHETRTLSGRVEFEGISFDHRPHLLKMRRGKKLRCTSCHGQIVQGSHMTVTKSTCFLCHFKDQHFNEGLGSCTRCHQIPEEQFDLGGGITFHHDLAYEKGVDCANCHGDLIRGDGAVPQERCRVCRRGLPSVPSGPPPRASEDAVGNGSPKHFRKDARHGGGPNRVPDLPSGQRDVPHGNRVVESVNPDVQQVPRGV